MDREIDVDESGGDSLVMAGLHAWEPILPVEEPTSEAGIAVLNQLMDRVHRLEAQMESVLAVLRQWSAKDDRADPRDRHR